MNPEHRKAVRLAASAFQAALAGKWTAAGRHLLRLNDECGGEGLHVALVAWCDTYVDHATDGDRTPARASMTFIRTDTGGLARSGSPDVPARIQWAGQLVQARAQMDGGGWDRLLAELPDDPGEIGSYVLAVLECITLTVNGLPRGFVRMGRTA